MENKNSHLKMKELVGKSERIATIGSPSTTVELCLDVLGTAVGLKLVGELAYFHFTQDGKDHFALGQITEIELRNAWLEDPTMRSLARQKGNVNPVSGQQDTHIGKMTLSAVFSEEANDYEPSMLGTVPPTGTYISRATEEELTTLLKQYSDQLFYLGKVYGSTPRLPLWFKHFDSDNPSKGVVGGAGEAYHLGIFGKSGSGKSVLAKLITIGYAKHRNMGMFILDPQGEFAKDLRQGETLFEEIGKAFSPKMLRNMGREYQVYTLSNINLNRYELLTQFLVEFDFFFDLGIKSSQYQETAADYIENYLRDNSKINFSNLDNNTLELSLRHLRDRLPRIYSTPATRISIEEAIDEVLDAIQNDPNHRVIKKWNNILRFFKPQQGKKNVDEIVKEVMVSDQNNVNRKITIIDLSEKPREIKQYVWDERVKPLIIDCFLDALIDDRLYKQDKSMNTLVVIDEAHRLAPRGRLENEKRERVRNRLIDAVRTTRKYGLGWLFISQTLSSLDKEIIEQLRIFFFGFGLSMGTEFQALKEIAGGNSDALKLYQTFRDPQSGFGTKSRQHSFMTVGPVSPLSFAGTPLFLTAFNEIQTFKDANKLK